MPRRKEARPVSKAKVKDKKEYLEKLTKQGTGTGRITQKQEVVFENKLKYDKAVADLKKAGNAEPSTKDIIERYVALGGAYLDEEGVRQNIRD